MSGKKPGLFLMATLLLAATVWFMVAHDARASGTAEDPTGTPSPATTRAEIPPPAQLRTGTPTVRSTPAPTRAPTRVSIPRAATDSPTARGLGATSTATATSTPDPRLGTGRWLQSIGDCAGARRELADLLAGKPQVAEASEARYRIAQCYLRDEAPAEATATLRQLLTTAPKSDPYRGPANFLLGDALSRQGRWKEAESSYLAYLPLAPEIKAVTWQRIGSARKAAGNLVGATQAYSTALQSSFDWTNTVAIRRALADLATAQGNYRAAATQYDLLRGKASGNAWASEMQLLAGSALAQGGNQAEAQRRWQAAIDADPKSRFAHQAVVAMLDAGALVDEYQRGVVDYYNGLHELAIEAFDRLRAADPTGRKGAAWYYTGLSYLALGQTDRGLAELGNLIAAYPDSPLWADAWLAKARAQAAAGKIADAVATYKEFASLRPDAAQAPKALWQAGNLLAEEDRTTDAAETYLALARRYPASDEGWRAYQAAGLSFFRQNEWRRAGEVWSEMSRAKLPSWTLPVAFYWLGRAQASAGETAAAQQSWQAAWHSDPSSYYGLRAADRVPGLAGATPGPGSKGGGPATGTPTVTPTSQPGGPGGPEQEAKPMATPGSRDIACPACGTQARETTEEARGLGSWLRSWAGEGTLSIPSAVSADPDWKRGHTLLTLGLRPQALTAFERVQQRYGKNPWTLASLVLAFRDIGAYRLSILSAEAVGSQWKGGTMRDAPAALQQLAYPLGYEDLIGREADKWGLDPRLLAAVIRQESRFETGATSTAGAQGLMQVMPGTAQGIASRLGWSDFEPEQAYWPYTNVALGANYLATWLEHFNGSLASALAAYNGGPGNAAIWRAWAPEDDDLMVALININETRVYVQAVYSQYDMYKRLYP